MFNINHIGLDCLQSSDICNDYYQLPNYKQTTDCLRVLQEIHEKQIAKLQSSINGWELILNLQQNEKSITKIILKIEELQNQIKDIQINIIEINIEKRKLESLLKKKVKGPINYLESFLNKYKSQNLCFLKNIEQFKKYIKPNEFEKYIEFQIQTIKELKLKIQDDLRENDELKKKIEYVNIENDKLKQENEKKSNLIEDLKRKNKNKFQQITDLGNENQRLKIHYNTIINECIGFDSLKNLSYSDIKNKIDNVLKKFKNNNQKIKQFVSQVNNKNNSENESFGD